MGYKLIVMDMDDTLMTSDNEVSAETAKYLMNIQAQGYKVVLASGRPTDGMMPTAKHLKLDQYKSYVISYNGGKTVNVSDEKAEVSRTVSKSDFDSIVDFCRAHSLFVLTYQDGYILYEGEHEYMNIESELTGLPMKQVDDLKAYIQQDVPKVMGIDYVPNITSIRNNLDGHFNENIDVTTSKPFFLEFMAQGVSKGNAITELCQKLDINLSQVIGFGDSSNDISMLKVVGKAVAMGNANDDVKAVADEVTLTNDNDGIPHTLKSLLN
ncbi:Cof-type HAD-IIB family hydrolase [Staphylococcus cohnii]|uniref:Cof-type HAD-IIB family hydrolase n=1 Tax=Staphylococcus cohnii species complex TaxID=3239053 RepID=UPI00085CACF0|nr:Cof-type HAD-IIB family hydrolase [Staphylococcus ureilyticus]PTG42590.1 Cof-type HAD-IIB family hydrolase [Staphylococcus cohnii]PUZ34706.1 Cof-type HAD-IIB family hydrolase [Staphylococcus cohnii]SCS51457.1 HAD superfamily hydrolase [Staphylococcus cohnii subsp. cohnii]HJG67250.1 Cof-type HAD-IIB family hydrolase [Staphylococcus ureilyticus]